MVRKGSVIVSVLRPMSITPPTSNTIMRGPFASAAALNEPGPSGASVVTRMILPPRPPGVAAAGPTAPGKAVAAESAAKTGLAGRAGEIGKHTSELQSLMRISYAVFCLKKKKNQHNKHYNDTSISRR